jgi:hypothetical protein
MAKVVKTNPVTPCSTTKQRLDILIKHRVVTNPIVAGYKEAKIMHITKEMASDLVSCNILNRPLSGAWHSEISHLMERGKFQLSNDAITFDEDGFLTNGQHRLYAVIESGVTCEFIVGFGIPFTPDMDTGRKRSLLDNIKLFSYGIDEKLHTANIVSVCKNACRYMSKTGKVSYDEVIDFMLHYQKELLDLRDVIGGKNGTCWHRTALLMSYIGTPNNNIPYVGTTVIPTLNEIKEFYSVYVSDSSNAPKHNPIRAIKIATGELFAGGFGGSDAHKKEIISITQDALCQFINGTCTNVLEKYIPESLYHYDMQFLNFDINGLPMKQFKYR